MRLLGVVLMLFACYGQSSEFKSAVISNLMLDKQHGNKVFIQLDAPQSSAAQCHQSIWHFVLDLTDAVGEKQFAMLLTLHASGKSARFVGNNLCELHEGIETLTRLEMK